MKCRCKTEAIGDESWEEAHTRLAYKIAKLETTQIVNRGDIMKATVRMVIGGIMESSNSLKTSSAQLALIAAKEKDLLLVNEANEISDEFELDLHW